tara:strand:- start:262 stop:2220 length:1959 start_codon:yes stop_codon:yes gene_type:complete
LRNYFSILSFLVFIAQDFYADSFVYNSFNNHGVIGLVNMPTARFYDEASHGITIYDGTPDQKITMTAFPYDWLEASFFYTNIQDKPYCSQLSDIVCQQDYKDKGFNFKFRVKEEGLWPAIAVGINDFAGTGLYSSEYIVGSYGVNRIDFHFGIGWGAMNGSSNGFKNPLGYIYEGFNDRPTDFEDMGGQIQPSRYFSGETASPFFGLSYAINEKILFKFESDTTMTPGDIGYENPKNDYSFGFDVSIKDNFNIGISSERGNYLSLKFIYKNNPKQSTKAYRYKESEINKPADDKYVKLRRNIQNNGIGVNKIIETADSIGIELTQFTHPNLDIIEEIIKSASIDSGINKNIKKDLRIANLQAATEFDDEFENSAKIIYERNKSRNFYTTNTFTLRPFLASREDFFKGALLFENNSEYVISDNFFFSSNLKYSLLDNFDDLEIPPENTYPAQVRSDIKDYLRNIDEGIIIGRAQFDYHITLKKNHHLMLTGGILEEMFSGIGTEYLHFKNNSNYAFGFEIFQVQKRDYEMRFGRLDYKNVTYSANFHYRNYKYIPFDMKLSYGEYLAGDEGATLELSRSYLNGMKFGIFASFTDVSKEQFGEGSFDKGIYFNIPIGGNLISYSWRPLTKDPGAKLLRKHTLYDLLVKFKPYNY